MNLDTIFDGTGQWNRSVKCAAMFYRWRLADNYADILGLIRHHRRWLGQDKFIHDGRLLPRLLERWPLADDRSPRIWACFHIGPYALIARALLMRGCRVAVLLKDDVLEEQRNSYVAHFRKSFHRDPRKDELCFIPSGGAHALVKLRTALRNGFHVVAYLDGQEGAAGDKGWTGVSFRGMSMPARMGVAVLSRCAGVPIRPIVLTIDGNRLEVRSAGDRFVETKEDQQPAIQYCYDLLAEVPADQLLQWDNISRMFDVTTLRDAPTGGTPIWLPLENADVPMLFDIVSCTSVVIKERYFQTICRQLSELLARPIR